MTPEEYRLIKNDLIAEGIILIHFRYLKFGIGALAAWSLYLIKLYWLCISTPVKTIHAWCTPAGAIGYLLCLFSNRRLVLDSFEPHAEPMAESGTWKKNSFV